jgi:hypothetical protein
MPITITYPDATTLTKIDQDYISVLTQDDPIIQEFPIVTKDENTLQWEQMDNYYGLQNARGLGGQPGRVKQIGINRYSMEPGAYGDWMEVTEKEITERRQIGTFADFVDISDLVAIRQEMLTTREIQRVINVIWTLLSTGTFTSFNNLGDIIATDTFPIQVFNAAVAWSNAATAAPLSDFRAAKLLATGHSTRFNSQAKAFMNTPTYNNLIKNQNPNDLFGRRLANGGATINNLREANSYLLDDDLPQIVLYDEGYYTGTVADGGTFVRHLPNGKVVLVGKRINNAAVGEYRMTRNANNPNLEAGSYLHIVDSLDSSQDPIPRRIGIHKGHNGGPVIYYPSSVVVMNV